MPVALFGITNDALSLVVNLLILFLVVLWLALVAWTYFDARRRLQDSFLVVCATLCSLIFPFVGTIVYSILRPPEFLADQRERELEIRASELRVRQLEEQSCPNCEHPVERTFLRCPNCRARIKDPCETCGKPIDPRWSICPYCETPVERAPPPERRPQPTRRGRAPSRPAAPAPQSASVAPPKSRGAGSRSSRSDGGDAGRPPSTRQPARQPSSGEPTPTPNPSGEAARKQSTGEPAPSRNPSGSRQSRSSSKTAQQRTTSRQPKRSSE
jgi:hypothetical protein